MVLIDEAPDPNVFVKPAPVPSVVAPDEVSAPVMSVLPIISVAPVPVQKGRGCQRILRFLREI